MRIKPLTMQEAFDKASNHLMKQLKPAKTMGHCVYRHPGGLQCAIGCLIPDELLTLDINSYSIDGLLRYSEYIDYLFSNIDKRFLQNLQQVHDYSPVDEWKKQLRYLGKQYDLTLPESIA